MTDDTSVIKQLNEIKENNTNVSADDIAIIILDSDYNRMCQYANNIAYSIEDLFGWRSTKGYISKKTETNSVYISNINNIKGLEFPFLICVAPTTISKNIFSRNGIYTSLTRSFLTSYFIVDDKNEDFILNYTEALKQIFDGYIKITEPTDSERQKITTNIRKAKRERMPLNDIVDIIISEFYGKGIENEMIKTTAESLYKKHKNDAEVIERLRKICEQMI